ncbi:MAG: SMP-30/gluconolactonase/LRE family protein [Actinobacteria bacterium]|nr:SMP-30/gluconolactonase/LRE family protein [Actinomycetota bacterium]
MPPSLPKLRRPPAPRLPTPVPGVPRCRLGESPAWDAAGGRLTWVDVHGEAVHRLDPRSGRCVTTAVGERVGAAVPAARGGMVLAARSGFLRLEQSGRVVRLAAIEADQPRTRMNDGKCDPRGRFWAGSMSEVDEPTAALYRLSPDDSVRRLLGGVVVSNGIGWSPDGDTMYYVDSALRRIDQFEFDLGSGSLGARRTLVEIPPSEGVPDGLAVDAEGCIWVALFGAGTLRRFRPDGRPAGQLRLPVPLVTSCAFAGPALEDLYVTSAAHLPAAASSPLSGALFRCRPPTPGLPVAAFAGWPG